MKAQAVAATKAWWPVALVWAALIVWTGVEHWVWIDALWGQDPVHTDPQGAVRAVLVNEWRAHGAPTFFLDRSNDLPSRDVLALVPRDASIVEMDVVPKDFAYPVVAAYIASFAGQPGVVLAPVVAALSIAVLLGLTITRVTTSPLLGALGALLYQTSLVAWAGSHGGAGFRMFGFTFGLAAIYLLVKPGPKSPWTYLAAGLLGGCACGWHYATTVWWGTVLLALAIGRYGNARQRVQHVGLVFVGAVFGAAPILAFNQWLYGSPLTTGYSTFSRILESINWQAPSVGFSFSTFQTNVTQYALRPEFLPVLVLALYGISAVRQYSRQGKFALPPHLVVLPCLGAIALISISGGSTLWGTNRFQTNASFLRYLLPLFLVVVGLAVVGIRAWWDTRNLGLRIISILVMVLIPVINITTIYSGQNGIKDSHLVIERSRAQLVLVLNETPPDSFIVTGRQDKLLFPRRSTLIAAYLQSPEASGLNGEHLYEGVPTPERLADLAVQTSPRFPVYIFNDSNWFSPTSQTRLRLLLAQEGLCLSGFADPSLYKVDGNCVG